MYQYVKLMMDKEVDEVPLDLDEAVYYSRRGAEKDEGHCMYYYGLFLFDGDGVEQNREEAIEWIQRARNKYIVEADYLLYRFIKFNVTNAIKERQNELGVISYYFAVQQLGDMLLKLLEKDQ